MEQKENVFLIDVLNILPETAECLIQAPSIENIIIKEMLKKTHCVYFEKLTLNKYIKEKIINEERINSFGAYIQKMEIRKGGIKLFVLYDGCEYGIVSKLFKIPEWFKSKYIPATCMVSDEW